MLGWVSNSMSDWVAVTVSGCLVIWLGIWGMGNWCAWVSGWVWPEVWLDFWTNVWLGVRLWLAVWPGVWIGVGLAI